MGAAFRKTRSLCGYISRVRGAMHALEHLANDAHLTEAWVLIYKCIELHHSGSGMPPAFPIAQSGRIPARRYCIMYLRAHGRPVEISPTHSRHHCLYKCKFVRCENFPAAVQYIISIPTL